MPIYEYTCTDCEAEHEVIQKISDGPLKSCPACNESSLVKKTSRSAFHLKGGGWYKDGYGAPSGGSSDKKASNGGSSDKKASSDGSSDKKAANGGSSSKKASSATKASGSPAS
ncbi:MAG: FmdB family transcriptional regulator [SAR324 cluster bacterium]|uniref:FmdB family transcriptional regulator n=1 Tax=SAR324 cluster bacterium TaxID=2024889 RepID=A0A2A4T909_9DELT|nr:MAG: FmdB family transcriptional regulator [SAR324 cluster bacterium]